MTHGSLFSGIGGFDLAARNVGWTNVFHCEKDEFAGKVLKHHFPEAETFTDIKEFDATPFRGRVQCISGGFPCQPFSAAGKRAGTSDDRHLWPEMLRVISEVMPRWVVGENVRGLLSWGDGTEGTEGMVLDEIVSDLEGLGYEVFPTILPAASVNAPHRRDRIWIVAHAHDQRGTCGLSQVQGADGEVSQRHDDAQPSYAGAADASNANGERLQRRMHQNRPEETARHIITRSTQQAAWQDFPTVAPICGGDDGLPKRLDDITFSKWRRESIKCYGNAIVVPLVEMIFNAINEQEGIL